MNENPPKECPDCRYLREERAGIHEFLGGADRQTAEALASVERCPQHQEAFVIVVANIWNGTPAGPVEYVGRNRKSRLGNPYRIGVDGNRDQCVKKYRAWLWEHIEARDEVFAKLGELIEMARKEGRLALLCHCKPQACHADVIADALRWLDREERKQTQ